MCNCSTLFEKFIISAFWMCLTIRSFQIWAKFEEACQGAHKIWGTMVPKSRDEVLRAVRAQISRLQFRHRSAGCAVPTSKPFGGSGGVNGSCNTVVNISFWQKAKGHRHDRVEQSSNNKDFFAADCSAYVTGIEWLCCTCKRVYTVGWPGTSNLSLAFMLRGRPTSFPELSPMHGHLLCKKR